MNTTDNRRRKIFRRHKIRRQKGLENSVSPIISTPSTKSTPNDQSIIPLKHFASENYVTLNTLSKNKLKVFFEHGKIVKRKIKVKKSPTNLKDLTPAFVKAKNPVKVSFENIGTGNRTTGDKRCKLDLDNID